MIFYKSKYGHSKRYADELSRRTGIPCVELKKENIRPAHNPVFIMGAYAGGLNGSETAIEILKTSSGQPIFCICGLSDPNDPQTMEASRKYLINCGLGDGKDPVFFLRGGIDYSELTKIHSVMMWMLYQKVKNDKTFIDNGFLDTYGKQVDFFDPKWLNPVIERMKQSV